MRWFQGAALIAATMTVGLMSGVFGHYALAVMPGLGQNRRPNVRRGIPGDRQGDQI